MEDDKILSQNISDALKAESHITEIVYEGILAERMLKKDEIKNC